jgi:hypothetical protein
MENFNKNFDKELDEAINRGKQYSNEIRDIVDSLDRDIRTFGARVIDYQKRREILFDEGLSLFEVYNRAQVEFQTYSQLYKNDYKPRTLLGSLGDLVGNITGNNKRKEREKSDLIERMKQSRDKIIEYKSSLSDSLKKYIETFHEENHLEDQGLELLDSSNKSLDSLTNLYDLLISMPVFLKTANSMKKVHEFDNKTRGYVQKLSDKVSDNSGDKH